LPHASEKRELCQSSADVSSGVLGILRDGLGKPAGQEHPLNQSGFDEIWKDAHLRWRQWVNPVIALQSRNNAAQHNGGIRRIG
jgi:hypothetical protein